MKKIIFIFCLFFLSIGVFAYQYDTANDYRDAEDRDDLDDTSLSFLADYDTVWLDLGIHSPIDTYNPAVHFQTRFILNDKFRLGLVGSFYNEATFENVYDEDASQSYKIQDWSAIKDYVEAYLGWRYSRSIHFGFMFGGGVNIDEYYKKDFIPEGKTIEKERGYGFLKSGFSIKLNSNLFFDNINYFFAEQFVEARFNGNGSSYVEDSFTFGTAVERNEDFTVPLVEDWFYDHNANSSETNSSNSGQDSSFKYTGFQTYGKVGISIPLERHVKALSIFNTFELKFELYNKISPRFYSTYTYYDESTFVQTDYKISSHFDYSGVALFMAMVFRPIREVEVFVSYTPNFLVQGTNWYDLDNDVIRKDYSFYLVHKVEASFFIRFPKVVTLKLGTIYYIKHQMDYQYENDGTNMKESLGGGGLVHELKHVLEPICELGFNLVERHSTVTKLTFAWEPRVVLYDPESQTYRTDITSTDYEINTNILNLANWRLEVGIQFNPKVISEADVIMQRKRKLKEESKERMDDARKMMRKAQKLIKEAEKKLQELEEKEEKLKEQKGKDK